MNRQIFKHFAGVASIAAVAFAAAPVAAQETVSLDSEVQVEKQVEDQTVYVAPEQVFPGDRLKFVSRYSNAGSETVEDFVITNPLPAAVALAADGEFLVSVDKGANFAPLASLTVAEADGSQRAAMPADVTHVRWVLAEIAPGSAGEVWFLAQVK